MCTRKETAMAILRFLEVAILLASGVLASEKAGEGISNPHPIGDPAAPLAASEAPDFKQGNDAVIRK
jgi:hypothetical protein